MQPYSSVTGDTNVSLTAASYLPECQVITLREHFDAFADPNDTRGIQTPQELGFFFHEWLHYLHNISTVQGLSAFSNQVGLWTNFRLTIGPDGLSQGSATLPPEWQVYVRQNLSYLTASRAPRQNNFPGIVDLHRLEITAAVPSITEIEGTGTSMTIIRCDAVLLQADGFRQPVSLEIGTNEILESLAVIFETELVRRLGGAVVPAAVAPYRLLEALGKHCAPDLSLAQVALCGLGSLQWSDAPGELLSMMARGQQARAAGDDTTSALASRTSQLLAETTDWREQTLKDLENCFPVDDSLSRAIKQTVANFRSNFAARILDPFFEWEIIAKSAQGVSRMDEVVRRHGVCAVIQRRPGDPDAIDRDVMFDFVVGQTDPILGYGWRKMHASFRFLALHSTANGFAATGSLRPSERTKCPFYTACTYEPRHRHPNVCAREPWNTLSCGDESSPCWYHSAVFVMRPQA